MKEQVAVGDVGRRILDLFRERDDVVSGEELSAHLGMSRTAIWKHISSLRALGYLIESVPARGYRLAAAPDILVPSEISSGLSTTRVGRNIVSFRETDSTNVVAFRMAEEGHPEGTVVIADAQRHGKGRLGRTWVSPPGVNLYLSVILRPGIMPLQASQLTFVSAVAVARAIAGVSGLEASIKWPNDILVNGKKVAGLLNEMSAETDEVNFVILGIGVNVNMSDDQFPGDLRFPATSIALEKGEQVSRKLFVQRLLEELEALYDLYLGTGFEPVRIAWEELSAMKGREVLVTDHQREIHGVAGGIDEFGALLLTFPDGSAERVYAGDVSLRERK